MVQRYDFGRLRKAKPLPGGGVLIPASLTRVGVFEYEDAAGCKRRELRLPEEVFNEDSLASLPHAPVTRLHPPEMVNASNWGKYAIGSVTPTVKRDGDCLVADIVVNREDEIQALNVRDLEEISMGYQCSLDIESGIHPEYGRYDAIQRNIKFNHAALGPKNWGRMGNECSVRLDSDDALMVRTTPQEKPKPKEEIKMDTIELDGIPYEVGSPAFKVAFAKKLDSISDIQKAVDVANARADAAEANAASLQTKLDSAPDLADLVCKRSNLIASANKLDSKLSFSAETDREIMVAALVSVDEKFDASDKSDDYIQARFDLALEAPPKDTGLGELKHSARTPNTTKNDSTERTIKAAKADLRKDSQEAWRKPLSISKGSN